MLAGMRHTAILGCMLFAVTLAACGGGPSEADIEATVEARLKEERATETTVEDKAQAIAKPMVETTAQAVPTATPIPPSSTPTSAPKIFADSSQSFGNSGNVGVSKSDLDSNGGPERPTSQPSRFPLNKPKYPRLDSTLNKLVGQISSRSTADIAGSAPVSIGDLVAVTVRVSHAVTGTVEFLESVGAIVANIGTDYIEAYTPVTFLAPLSERDGVLRIQAIIPSEPAVTDN